MTFWSSTDPEGETMRMKLAALLIAVAGAASADHPLFDSRTQEMPPMTTLRDWEGVPLIPRGTRQFFTVTTHAPLVIGDSLQGFIAYGIDVDEGKVLYRISLANVDELSSYGSRLNIEHIRVSLLENVNPTQDIRFGEAGQLVAPPPPPPGPNGDGWLAMRLVRLA